MNQKELETHLQSLHSNCKDLFEFWITYSELHKAYNDLSKVHAELRADYDKRVSHYQIIIKELKTGADSHQSCRAEINSLRKQLDEKSSKTITRQPTIINSPKFQTSSFTPVINTPPQHTFIQQTYSVPSQQPIVQPSRVQINQPVVSRLVTDYQPKQCICPCPDPNYLPSYNQSQMATPLQFPTSTLHHSKSQIITPINKHSSFFRQTQADQVRTVGNGLMTQEDCEICRNALSGKGPFTPHSHGFTYK